MRTIIYNIMFRKCSAKFEKGRKRQKTLETKNHFISLFFNILDSLNANIPEQYEKAEMPIGEFILGMS